MKISTNLMFQRALDQMGDSQNKLSKLQAELSSGKSVVNPSDKPQEATTIQRIKSVISRQDKFMDCLLYTSPSPRDQRGSRMPSSA